MENSKKTRSVYRAYFSKVLNKLNNLIENDPNNQVDIEANLRLLEVKIGEIQVLDNHIFDLLSGNDSITEDELLAETSKAGEYLCLFETVKLRVQKILQQINDVVSAHSVSCCNSSGKRKFKLPKIELKRFDGNLINWLPFWSQFSKIHSDSEIDPEDKFQYLLQSVVVGSRAFDVVQSFPPTGDNYSKVIECLKTRFGKDDLLVEVYVRELLKIVLQNALGSKNTMNLQCLYDKLESHMRALETLGVTTDKCSSMLYPLVESCMPEDILRAWHRSSLRVGKNAQERLRNLMSFMLSEVEGEQRINLAMSGFGVNCSGKKKLLLKRSTPIQAAKTELPTASCLVSSDKNQNCPVKCIFCNKNHRSCDCFAAQKMPLSEKQSILKESKCCFRCLKPGHRIKFCQANVSCSLCKRRHYSIMCTGVPFKDVKKDVVNDCFDSTSKDMTVLEDNVLANKSSSTITKVFMQTVTAKLRNPNSTSLENVRILFDSGSQRSYILKDLAVKMGYESLGEETIIHSLFGNVQSGEQKHNRYRAFLTSADCSYKCNFEVLSQPVICGKISPVSDGPWLRELEKKNVYLSDVHETSLPIGILIGADVAGKLFTGNRFQLESGLVAMETLLGWTLMGKVSGDKDSSTLSTVVTSMFINDADVSELWRLDSIGITDPSELISKEQKDEAVQKYFLETTTVNEEGRYEVSLPWVVGHLPLPSHKDLAAKRLPTVVKKLDKSNMIVDYDSVFKQWLSDGIIEVVPSNELDKNCHYLPHRPVVKESSVTTRIRPVFDASAKSKFSPSLNDCIENGPNVIELIPSVMLRFREGKFGIISDIAKAFLQISLNKEDRDFLRFLWFDINDRNRQIVYRHKRVVFGVKCSPFLLGAVIDLHLQKMISSQRYDTVLVEKLRKSFYVDNVSTSLDTREELTHFETASREIMAAGKFDLRGWQATSIIEEENTKCVTNVLGIQWDYNEDVLFFNINWLKDFDVSRITKREILSISHKIFDPIGVLCPVMLFPKLLLQSMWNMKIDWDTEVSLDIRQKFIDWYSELIALQEVRVPRWIGKITNDLTGCSIHTFCDASKDAYATAIYLRVENGDGVNMQLLSAKSRVAPLKKTSIPRLELLAATVGARLTKNILVTMDWEDTDVYYWTDSSTVLTWIKQDSNLNVFVMNRVSEIRKLTDINQWRHVPGEMNPADLPSRGCGAKGLSESFWWEGPQWLKQSSEEWPKEKFVCNEEDIQKEKRKGIVTVCTDIGDNESGWYYKYFSTFEKIVRMIAWINRFSNNCRMRRRMIGPLSLEEIERAEIDLMKLIQKDSFSGLKDPKLASLCPFEDQNGLIRLRSKLIDRKDYDNFRTPIVLPSKHPVVNILIFSKHIKACHTGVQCLLSIIREDYWILNGRKAIKSVISTCVKCKRYKNDNLETAPVSLPEDRIEDAAVFKVSGVDFAGPVFLRDGQKAWICLFTCAVFRAVHLELVSSLTTNAFLQALSRFIARRGRPSVMYSDNGTNFVGANNAFLMVDWDKIHEFSTLNRIKWKFNPPSSPWWGGWWERLIGLMKQLLRKTLGKSSLTYEEFLTILCDCESVLNSRPLTYISNDVNDMRPLTPSMFLTDIAESKAPDLDEINHQYLDKRARYCQNLKEALRKRFRSEYLGLLMMKSKKPTRTLNTGEVVIIGTDDKRRLNWPLAVVEELIPGKDGQVRLTRLKTSTGTVLRPVQRIYPLEVQSCVVRETLKTKIKTRSENKETDGKIEEKSLISRSGREVKKPSRYT